MGQSGTEIFSPTCYDVIGSVHLPLGCRRWGSVARGNGRDDARFLLFLNYFYDRATPPPRIL